LNNTPDPQGGSNEAGPICIPQKDKFFHACHAAGIQASPQDLESFMRGAIEGREYAKFHFSRNLSSALDYLIEFGNEVGINRVELSHITWNELVSAKELSADLHSLCDHLKYLSQVGAKLKQYGSSVELPPLIRSITDFWWFYLPEAQANFIGSGQISSECIDLAENSAEDLDLEGKIVMIPRADPGYEWLFGRKIGGLITMYGGANSHMAIRAAEFNLPAAIGVGEKEYKRICSARILGLNAGNRKIDIIQ
jgi:phosphohistidine swiveling domain-containing protein